MARVTAFVFEVESTRHCFRVLVSFPKTMSSDSPKRSKKTELAVKMALEVEKVCETGVILAKRCYEDFRPGPKCTSLNEADKTRCSNPVAEQGGICEYHLAHPNPHQ